MMSGSRDLLVGLLAERLAEGLHVPGQFVPGLGPAAIRSPLPALLFRPPPLLAVRLPPRLGPLGREPERTQEGHGDSQPNRVPPRPGRRIKFGEALEQY